MKNWKHIIKITIPAVPHEAAHEVEQRKKPMQLAAEIPSTQHVYTPEGLAEDVVRLAAVRSLPGATVLEPCFGSGALIRAALAVQDDLVIVGYDINFNDALASFCKFECDPVSVRSRDFLRVSPTPVDVAIMHPPRELDVEMVTHALRFVRPGGKLVAIMGTSWQTDTSPSAQQLRAELTKHSFEVSKIKPGAFKGSGDHEGATMLVVRVGERS